MKKLRINTAAIALIAFYFFVISAQQTYAVTTKMWTNGTDQTVTLKGKLQNISLHSNGSFTLSPEKQKISEIPAAFVWCLVADGTDSLFAGTGNPGSIFKISHDGNVVEYFNTQELHVKTLAIDAAGNIFAGTLPNGRVYKITSEGKGELFCELPDPYIWDLISDYNGNLYAATGNNGIIYKISTKGIPSVVFDSQFSNIMDLDIDKAGNIYAACEPEGLVYKITANGDVSVLFDADEDEIHCLALDKNGVLYAGTSSGKPPLLHTPSSLAPPEIHLPLLIEKFPGESNDVWPDYLLSDGNMEITNDNSKDNTYMNNKTGEKPIVTEKNSVYRIDKDGRVREVFTVENSFVLCLAIDNHNNVIVGTGNNAKLFKIDNKEEVSLLYDFSETQVLNILSYKDGINYIATGNNANIYQLSGSYSPEGFYKSIVHDTTYISSWGCVSWNGNVPLQTNIKLSTRSGNNRTPDITWSKWSLENQQNGGKIKSPPARFIQYKAILTTEDPEKTPVLNNVNIAYLQQNQPPIINNICIVTPNHLPDNKQNINNNYDNTQSPFPSSEDVYLEGMQKDDFQHVTLGPKKIVSWEATDPNNDRLQFGLEYKSVDEEKWKELKSKIKEGREYYWNTNRIPDGFYQLKIEACDCIDNPLELSLYNEIVSDTFLVDNTRPEVLDLQSVIEGTSVDKNGRHGVSITVSGVASDNLCNITDIQFSINSGDWQTAFPEDKIFDSKEELFLLKIPYISLDEHTIVINAVDEEGNIGSSRIVFNP